MGPLARARDCGVQCDALSTVASLVVLLQAVVDAAVVPGVTRRDVPFLSIDEEAPFAAPSFSGHRSAAADDAHDFWGRTGDEGGYPGAAVEDTANRANRLEQLRASPGEHRF